LIFTLSREAALYETVSQSSLTPEGRRQRDLGRYRTMQGENVVSFREAGE
jgi:hypothetical protein